MTKSNWVLLIMFLIAYTGWWLAHSQADSYQSYLLGRERERNTLTLSYPAIGLDIYKNFCVDGRLNIHEVDKVGNKFISKKVHVTKNENAPL